MDNCVKNIISILDAYEDDRNRTRVFASVYSLYRILTSSEASKKMSYDRFILEALKMTVFRFNSIKYADYRVFMRYFVRLLLPHYVSKDSSVKELLYDYLQQLEHSVWHLTYIDLVDQEDLCFNEKVNMIMNIHDHMGRVFSALNSYFVSEELVTKIMYGYDDEVKLCNRDLDSRLKHRTYKILNSKSNDGDALFDPLALASDTMDGFLSNLSEEEVNLWGNMQKLLISGYRIFDFCNPVVRTSLFDENLSDKENRDRIIDLDKRMLDYIKRVMEECKEY